MPMNIGISVERLTLGVTLQLHLSAWDADIHWHDGKERMYPKQNRHQRKPMAVCKIS
jgi:hypothetical protein